MKLQLFDATHPDYESYLFTLNGLMGGNVELHIEGGPVQWNQAEVRVEHTDPLNHYIKMRRWELRQLHSLIGSLLEHE